MSAELAVLEELDAHRPSHREYEGGWWELACAGCDAFKGQRLSHLDWAPYRAHREELFRDALQTAGFRKPRTITTAKELDALPVGSVVRMSGTSEDTRVAVKDGIWKGESEWFVADADEWCLDSTELDDLPATVLYEPEATK